MSAVAWCVGGRQSYNDISQKNQVNMATHTEGWRKPEVPQDGTLSMGSEKSAL